MTKKLIVILLLLIMVPATGFAQDAKTKQQIEKAEKAKQAVKNSAYFQKIIKAYADTASKEKLTVKLTDFERRDVAALAETLRALPDDRASRACKVRVDDKARAAKDVTRYISLLETCMFGGTDVCDRQYRDFQKAYMAYRSAERSTNKKCK